LYSEDLYTIIATPLLRHLPNGSNIIATSIMTPFIVPIKLCFFITILITTPIIIYNVWAFVVPGLYKKEKKLLMPIILTSCLLFYIGIIFSFLLIIPLTINFFSTCAPQGVTIMTEISSYLDFITTVSILSGLIFQVPIITKIFINFNITTKKQLQEKRRYIIIFAFVIGMLLTPPDVLSQIILAIPIWLLFELGLLFS
jgi:sec-independent protein translocase protein TatC